MAARPKTLWAGIAPVIIGTAMAFGDGAFHWPSALCALLGSVLIQVGTNLANDYFDFLKGADTTERIGPTRATQAGLIAPQTMKRAAIAIFAAALLPGAYLVWRGGWPLVAIGLASILCGVLYTAGPFALGYIGLADLFVLIFFGPVAVGGTYYVQALSIHSPALLAGLATGLLSVALLTVNNLRDIDQDRQAGKRTLAVRFGRTFARIEYAACVAAAVVLIPLYLSVSHQKPWLLAVPIVLIILVTPVLRTVSTKTGGAELNAALAATGKLLLAFSVVFSITWLI